MAMSSSRTGTTGERGDARGMGIGVEECGQRAGAYVSSFARAACTVQHPAPCSQGAISRAGNISPVFPVSQARRLLRKPLLELTMKALVAAVSACLLLGVQGETDRKSTRLNSSHVAISYADFCLKKIIHTLRSPRVGHPSR